MWKGLEGCSKLRHQLPHHDSKSLRALLVVPLLLSSAVCCLILWWGERARPQALPVQLARAQYGGAMVVEVLENEGSEVLVWANDPGRGGEWGAEWRGNGREGG